MPTLTSSAIFDVTAAPAVYIETGNIVVYPQNAGSLAKRELHYPGDLLPPLIYEDNPDKWENFDSSPWTALPVVAAEKTLEGMQIVRWSGYIPDEPVREYWLGNETTARMTAYMLRRLYEYFTQPPASGYITWHPKDRTEQGYNVILENLQVGGSNIVTLDYLALLQGEVVLREIMLQLRIISEVEA